MSGIADRKESCDIAKKDGNPVRFPSFFISAGSYWFILSQAAHSWQMA